MIAPGKKTQAALLGMAVARKTTEYFEDPEHRREFETWYFAKYGVKYKWKKVQK